MKAIFHLQDPSNPKTIYLYEAIIQQLMNKKLVAWHGIYAFATGEAVRTILVDDPIGSSVVAKEEVNILVGLDAITNVSALETLSELERKFKTFTARVFMNPYSGLFHPKLSLFRYKDGALVLIVGSGNLTSGGLRKNIEAYTIIYAEEGEIDGLSEWRDFFDRQAKYILEINEDAIEKAKKNKIVSTGHKPKVKEVEPEEVFEKTDEVPEEVEEFHNDKVLVARVPKAGGRWHQIHYNKEIINVFFQAEADSQQRIFLKEVKEDGQLGEDEVRPLVYSKTNLNFKIEVSAKSGIDHSGSETPPIIILKEIGIRSFQYMLLMPGDKGYPPMFKLTEDYPSIGKGVKRVLTDLKTIISYWSDCPLKTS
jgi:hypothetical protein